MWFIKNKKKGGTHYFSKEAWRYYLKFFKSERNKLIGTSIGSTFQAFLIIPTLLLVRYIFDVVIPEKDPGMLIIIGLTIIFIRLINASTTLFLRRINIRIISGVIFRIREDLSKKIYTFSRDFYTREDLRILHTRITQDTERIMGMSNILATNFIPAILIISHDMEVVKSAEQIFIIEKGYLSPYKN